MLPLPSFASLTTLVLAVSVLFALPMQSASGAPDKPAKVAPQTHTVRIKGMVFVPATLEVSVGDTVVWVNDDLVPHTATATVDGVTIFDSGVLAAKAKWKYEASKTGTIPYVCLLHPTMKATLIVR